MACRAARTARRGEAWIAQKRRPFDRCLYETPRSLRVHCPKVVKRFFGRISRISRSLEVVSPTRHLREAVDTTR